MGDVDVEKWIFIPAHPPQHGVRQHHVLDEHSRSLPVATGVMEQEFDVPPNRRLPHPAAKPRRDGQINRRKAGLVRGILGEHSHFRPVFRRSHPLSAPTLTLDRGPQERVPPQCEAKCLPHRAGVDRTVETEVDLKYQGSVRTIVEPHEEFERRQRPGAVARHPRGVGRQKFVNSVHQPIPCRTDILPRSNPPSTPLCRGGLYTTAATRPDAAPEA